MFQTKTWRRLTVATAALVLSAVGTFPALAAQHVVRPGETLSGIAVSYGVPLATIAQQNAITNVNLIYAGQQLTIPTADFDVAAAAPAAPTPPASAPSSATYVVAAGDTLTSIAAAQGVRLADLLAANPAITDRNRILVGQVIAVPGGGSTTTASAPATTTAGPVVSAALVRQLLDADAATYGLDPLLVEALAWQESGWQQQVVSASGAVGVMQILPSSGAWIAQYIVGEPLSVQTSVADNILAGTAFLSWLVNRSATTQLALAAYYQGPTSVQQSGVQAGTRQYVAAVLAIRAYIAQHGVPPQS